MKKLLSFLLAALLSTSLFAMGAGTNRVGNPGHETATITATRTLTVQNSNFQIITPSGGSRNIDLTALSDSYGRWFTIKNASASQNLVVRTAAGATLATLTPGLTATFSCDGATWGVAVTAGSGLLADGSVAGATGAAQSFGANGVKADILRGATASTEVQINDSSDNELVKFTKATSAVNEFTFANAATGKSVTISATGGDTNISVRVTPKGVGNLSANSPITFKSTVTTDSTAGVVTYTAAQMLGGFINRDPNGAGRSDVTPAAADLVAAFTGATVGDSFYFTIRNNADANETVTVTAGSNCTLSGSGQSTTTVTIAQNNSKMFLCRLTNVQAGSEAYTLYSIGTFVH